MRKEERGFCRVFHHFAFGQLCTQILTHTNTYNTTQHIQTQYNTTHCIVMKLLGILTQRLYSQALTRRMRTTMAVSTHHLHTLSTQRTHSGDNMIIHTEYTLQYSIHMSNSCPLTLKNIKPKTPYLHFHLLHSLLLHSPMPYTPLTHTLPSPLPVRLQLKFPRSIRVPLPILPIPPLRNHPYPLPPPSPRLPYSRLR